MNDGRSAETMSVGRESAVALLNVLTGAPIESQIFAQVPGTVLRLPAGVFLQRVHESPQFAALIWRHIYTLQAQTAQFMACNVLHDARQRLARWLLMTADRTGSNTFALTQDYMAVMVGVQRTTISVLAAGFKDAGLIRYSRGDLSILDPEGLRRAACECSEFAHRQFESLRQAE